MVDASGGQEASSAVCTGRPLSVIANWRALVFSVAGNVGQDGWLDLSREGGGEVGVWCGAMRAMYLSAAPRLMVSDGVSCQPVIASRSDQPHR